MWYKSDIMRMVCQFSCGAASAVATKMTCVSQPDDLLILNAFIEEEHPDNRRFLADCEHWFGYPVQVVRNKPYHASAREVFRRGRYLKGPMGAHCSKVLKRDILNRLIKPDDTIVLGFTVDESDRFDRWLDANNDKRGQAPLIEQKLTKRDCLAIVARAGLELPLMYRLGYHNANCIGCVKGGEGYWNKIRVDFPDDFEEMARIEESIGPGAYLFRGRRKGSPLYGRRFGLRELPPDSGQYRESDAIECGAACELAEQTIRDDVDND